MLDMDIYTYVENHVGERVQLLLPCGVVSGALYVEGDVASGSRLRDERDGTVYVLDSRARIVPSPC